MKKDEFATQEQILYFYYELNDAVSQMPLLRCDHLVCYSTGHY